MGFFGSLVSSAVKVALTPVAVATDVVRFATGQEPDSTKDLIDSAMDDLCDAVNEVTGG